MGEMSELAITLDEIVVAGQELLRQILEFREELMPKNKKEDGAQETVREGYSKEEIRALLAQKASEDGGRFRADVKAIVKKYGNGGSLTDVPEERYPDIVREVQELKAA